MSQPAPGGHDDWYTNPDKPGPTPGESNIAYANRIRTGNAARRAAGLDPWPLSASSLAARAARDTRRGRAQATGDGRRAGAGQEGASGGPGDPVLRADEGVEAEQVAYSAAARGVTEVGHLERLDHSLGKLTQIGFQFTGKIRLSSFKHWLRAQGIDPQSLKYAPIWDLGPHEVKAWGSALAACVEAMPKKSAQAVKAFLKHQAPWVTLLFVSWMSIYPRIEQEELSRIAILEAIRRGQPVAAPAAKPAPGGGAGGAARPVQPAPAVSPNGGAPGGTRPPIAGVPGGPPRGSEIDPTAVTDAIPDHYVQTTGNPDDFENFYKGGIGPVGSG